MAKTQKLKVVARPEDFQKQHPDDAGFDLRLKETVVLYPGQPSQLLGTGVRVQIPSNCVGLVVVRSSIGLRGIQITGSVGVIDSGYRGEIKIPLINHSSKPQTLFAGERVAQLLIVPLQPVKVEFVEELEASERGEGGFGSTGQN